MKHVKNILVFISLWGICYYFGKIEGAAYDGFLDGKDIVCFISGIGGLVWLYSKYAK
jgi:hypothetical protein